MAETSTPAEHKAHAPHSIGCWVLTISDTKTPATDTSGALIRELLAGVTGAKLFLASIGIALAAALQGVVPNLQDHAAIANSHTLERR